MTIQQVQIIVLTISTASCCGVLALTMIDWGKKPDPDNSLAKKIHSVFMVIGMAVAGISTGTFWTLVLLRLFLKDVF